MTALVNLESEDKVFIENFNPDQPKRRNRTGLESRSENQSHSQKSGGSKSMSP